MTKNTNASTAILALILGAVVSVSFLPAVAQADGDWDYYSPTTDNGDYYGGTTNGDYYGGSNGDYYGGSNGDYYGGTTNGDYYGGNNGDYYGGTTDWVEPTTVTYTEPGSYSYYEPSSYSYYEPTSYNYYEPSTYSYYTPSSYSYYDQPYYSSQPYSYSYPSYSNNNYSGYTYDYSYDYVYDYEYTYEYDYDGCKNLPGNQPQDYDCYPDVHDECSNIPGNQPNGYDCHPDNDDEDISCELTASDRTVEEGDEITLEWDIDGNATYASINQGIGRVDEDGGEEDVDVDEDTTFRLTVRDNHGNEDTCSVTVRVDDENNFSSVSFTGEPTYNPPVVYLSDIPYTGLEDIDPTLLSYWLMLIAAAGAGAWFLYRRGMIPQFAFATAEPIEEGHVEEAVEEGHADASPEVLSFLSALDAGDTDAAVDVLRDAAASGTDVEELLADAAGTATDSGIAARVAAAYEASKVNGIRGAKIALA